jgi:hypothetical protein
VAAAFDEPNLISDAGLVPVVRPAGRGCLSRQPRRGASTVRATVLAPHRPRR